MYNTEINKIVGLIQHKISLLKEKPQAIGVGGMLGGAYIGVAILLIATLGTEVSPELRKLVMGATFGLALVLVVFAGAELYTGYTMYCTFGVLNKKINIVESIKISLFVWLANLAGALLLAGLYKLGQGQLIKSADTAIQLLAYKKMNGSAIQLFSNGILCNWLVCLAIWMAYRIQSASAKLVAIAWCLMAFIACGFEHSIANMTVFSLALLGPSVDGINFTGAVWNLLWVTLGNAVGGAGFVAGSYWCMSTNQSELAKK